MLSSTRPLAILCLIALFTPSCGSSGNLIFLSTQKFGLDVSTADPTTGGTPRLSLGYTSFKGVLNPIKEKDGTLRKQAYSVVGITNGGVQSKSPGVGWSTSEWFATGKAAEEIARNPNTPSALAGLPTLTPEVLAKIDAQGRAKIYEALVAVRTFIAAQPIKTAEMQLLLSALDGLAPLADQLKFKKYSFAVAGPTVTVNRPDFNPATDLSGHTGFDRIDTARLILGNGMQSAKNLQSNANATGAQQTAAADATKILGDLRTELDASVLTSTAGQALWQFFIREFSATGSK